jgi:hypothetical protein
MGLYIKEVQYNQLVSLISFATCDNKCDDCYWKNNGDYNFSEYPCLLQELRDILPNENPKLQENNEYQLNYLKRKEEKHENKTN